MTACSGFNLFPKDRVWALPNRNSLQMTICKFDEMGESSQKGYKTLWEKEKLLAMSNFSFSHGVFKTFAADMQNPGLV